MTSMMITCTMGAFVMLTILIYANPHSFVCSANHGIPTSNRKKGWMLKGANGCGLIFTTGVKA